MLSWGHPLATLRTAGQFALNLLFPLRCAACRRLDHGTLCARCIESFEVVGDDCCGRCGEPGKHQPYCDRCRSDPPHIDWIRSAFTYSGHLQNAIHAFKYKGHPELAQPLADAALKYLRRPAGEVLLCPIPLHAGRAALRGYNQSRLLAERWAMVWNLATVPSGSVERIKPTKSQVGQSYDSRQENLAGAFQADATLLNGRPVILVDDVCTTGATMNACAEAVWAAGAVSVAGLTLARA